MTLEAHDVHRGNRISRRKFITAVGAMAGTAVCVPGVVTAQAPTGKPAEPLRPDTHCRAAEGDQVR